MLLSPGINGRIDTQARDKLHWHTERRWDERHIRISTDENRHTDFWILADEYSFPLASILRLWNVRFVFLLPTKRLEVTITKPKHHVITTTNTTERLHAGRSLCWKAPRARSERVVFGKQLGHPGHIPCQQVFPAYLGHPREMVYFLRIQRVSNNSPRPRTHLSPCLKSL